MKRPLLSILRGLLMGMVCCVLANAQTVPFNAIQTAFFDQLLRTLGDPTQVSSTLEAREKEIVAKYSLTTTETAALHAASQKYHDLMVQFPPNSVGQWPNGAARGSMMLQRNQLIRQIINFLLPQFSSVTLVRFASAYQAN